MNLIIDKEKLVLLKQEKNIEKKYTILLVDDEQANIEALTRILEEEYNVIGAKDGFEALSIIQNDSNPSRINLIISDQRMPGMMGIEFLKRTIDIIPNTIRIVLTGFTDVNDIISSINDGQIYKFLTKPIEPNELVISVKRSLEAYELKLQNIKLIEKLSHTNEDLEKKIEERTYQLKESIEILKKQKQDLEYLNEFKNKLVCELQHLSDTDPLTELPNRRKLKGFLEIEWEKAIDEKKVISIIMMDIDCFKAYNDHYGHLLGDDCLKKIAGIIENEIKNSTDIVARYGGEEFCCVLTQTSLDRALDLAKNFYKAIKFANIPHEKSPVDSYITLSFGVASMSPNNENSWQELMEIADGYLYEAKNNGKNCIFSKRGGLL